jgi:hypothetical protein
MDGLKNKLNQTYLDGSPGRYGNFFKEYDASSTYLNSPEGAIRGQGDLLELYKTMKQKGLLDNPSTPYTTIIGSEVTNVNTSTPYNSKNSYSDQFRLQGNNETLLNRTIDFYK